MSDTTVLDNENPDTDDSESNVSPGEMLRVQREKLGLTESSVAEDLHITQHYVRLLESNTFEKLPGIVFAKGYIKTYAELLGLDQSIIVSLFNEYTQQLKEAEEAEAQLRRARRYKDKNLPWIVFSGIAFVIVLFGLWFFSGDEQNTSTGDTGNSATGNGISNSANVAASVQQELPSQTPADTIAAVPVAGNTLLADVISNELPISSEAGGDKVVNTSDTEFPESLDLAQSTNDSVQPESDEPGVVESSDSQSQDPAISDEITQNTEDTDGEEINDEDNDRVVNVTADGSDVLQISFSGESWIEVNDRNDNRIYRDIREAGDVVVIKGTAPFNVLLGDAVYAELSFNGSAIDFATEIRIDNSARFSIGL